MSPRKPILAQILAAVTATLNMFATALWIGWPAVVISKIKSGELPITMTASEMSWMVALMEIGNLLSPIPSGYLMDRYGRLFTLRLNAVILLATSVTALTATTPYQLCLVRFLAGIGKGICFTITSPYLGEIAGPEIRGKLNGIFGVMGALGIALSMTFGSYITFSQFSWFSAVFSILTLIFCFIIHESPYFFFMRNRNKDAESAFCWFRDDGIIDNTSELSAIKDKVKSDMQQASSFSELFSGKSNRKAMSIVLSLHALQRLGGCTSIISYGTLNLPQTFWDSRITLVIFGWAATLACVASTSISDSLGRKPLLLISSSAISFVIAAMALFHYLHDKTTINMNELSFLPHIGFILYATFFFFGTNQVPLTLQSELLPTNIKSLASAISNIVLSVASFIVNKACLSVSSSVGVYAMYLEFCVCNLLIFFSTLFYVFETKGKTLAEIQDILIKS